VMSPGHQQINRWGHHRRTAARRRDKDRVHRGNIAVYDRLPGRNAPRWRNAGLALES
jgi:hypothetical protein